MILANLPLLLSLPLFAQGVTQPSLSAGYQQLQQAIKTNQAADPIDQAERILLDQLNDWRSQETRRSAVRALKAYVNRSVASREKVISIVEDRREEAPIQYEALKTLSAATGHEKVSDLLISVGESGWYGDSLRRIAYRALYWREDLLKLDEKVLTALLNAATSDNQTAWPTKVRTGALWALFNWTPDADVRSKLLYLVLSHPETSIRLEALKSLYGAMNDEEINDKVRYLARTEVEPAVRNTAILMLASSRDPQDIELLEHIAANDQDEKARSAAITALGGPNTDAIAHHFHLIVRDSRGVLIEDPLNSSR